jgi:transmembrane sensor
MADDRRDTEALDWARRLSDPSFADWDEHILWLERDTGNAAALDRACLAMDEATQGLAPPPPLSMAAPVLANDNHAAASTSPHGRRWWIGGLGSALAASVAGLLFLMPGHQAPAPARVIETAANTTRDIALPDGTRITLNGGSRLEVSGSGRTATLARGEAYFDVVHDPQAPFALQAGGTVIRDVGTLFDVSVDPEATRVAVRQGEVAIGRGDQAHLRAGQRARIDRDGTVVRQADSDPAAVGGWRSGRLVYRDSAWSDVAADLGRSVGTPVTLDPRMAGGRFTGVIMIDADRDRSLRRFAASAGLAADRDRDGWRLSPR